MQYLYKNLPNQNANMRVYNYCTFPFFYCSNDFKFDNINIFFSITGSILNSNNSYYWGNSAQSYSFIQFKETIDTFNLLDYFPLNEGGDFYLYYCRFDSVPFINLNIDFAGKSLASDIEYCFPQLYAGGPTGNITIKNLTIEAATSEEASRSEELDILRSDQSATSATITNVYDNYLDNVFEEGIWEKILENKETNYDAFTGIVIPALQTISFNPWSCTGRLYSYLSQGQKSFSITNNKLITFKLPFHSLGDNVTITGNEFIHIVPDVAPENGSPSFIWRINAVKDQTSDITIKDNIYKIYHTHRDDSTGDITISEVTKDSVPTDLDSFDFNIMFDGIGACGSENSYIDFSNEGLVLASKFCPFYYRAFFNYNGVIDFPENLYDGGWNSTTTSTKANYTNSSNGDTYSTIDLTSTNLSEMFRYSRMANQLDGKIFSTMQRISTMSYMFQESKISIINPIFASGYLKDCSYMFSGFRSTLPTGLEIVSSYSGETTLEAMFENLGTTNIEKYFKAETLQISNISNVTNIFYNTLFSYFDIDFLLNRNTDILPNIYYIFSWSSNVDVDDIGIWLDKDVILWDQITDMSSYSLFRYLTYNNYKKFTIYTNANYSYDPDTGLEEGSIPANWFQTFNAALDTYSAPYANYIADVEVTITDYLLLSKNLEADCVDNAALTITTRIVQLSNNDYYSINAGNELIISGQILGVVDGNYAIASGIFTTENGSVIYIIVESTDEETHITSIDFEIKVSNISVEEVFASNDSQELITETQTTNIVYTAAYSYEDEETGETINVDGSWGLANPIDDNDDWQIQTFASQSVWKFYKGTKVRVVGNTTKKDPPEDEEEEWTIVKEEYEIPFIDYDEQTGVYTFYYQQTLEIDGFESNTLDYYSNNSVLTIEEVTPDDITDNIPDGIYINKNFNDATITNKINRDILPNNKQWLFLKYNNYADNINKIAKIKRVDNIGDDFDPNPPGAEDGTYYYIKCVAYNSDGEVEEYVFENIKFIEDGNDYSIISDETFATDNKILCFKPTENCSDFNQEQNGLVTVEIQTHLNYSVAVFTAERTDGRKISVGIILNMNDDNGGIGGGGGSGGSSEVSMHINFFSISNYNNLIGDKTITFSEPGYKVLYSRPGYGANRWYIKFEIDKCIKDGSDSFSSTDETNTSTTLYKNTLTRDQIKDRYGKNLAKNGYYIVAHDINEKYVLFWWFSSGGNITIRDNGTEYEEDEEEYEEYEDMSCINLAIEIQKARNKVYSLSYYLDAWEGDKSGIDDSDVKPIEISETEMLYFYSGETRICTVAFLYETDASYNVLSYKITEKTGSQGYVYFRKNPGNYNSEDDIILDLEKYKKLLSHLLDLFASAGCPAQDFSDDFTPPEDGAYRVSSMFFGSYKNTTTVNNVITFFPVGEFKAFIEADGTPSIYYQPYYKTLWTWVSVSQAFPGFSILIV